MSDADRQAARAIDNEMRRRYEERQQQRNGESEAEESRVMFSVGGKNKKQHRGTAKKAGQPSASTPSVMPRAKIVKGNDVTNNIDKELNNFNGSGYTAKEFLFRVAKAFGLSEPSFDNSYYASVGKGGDIRIANHYADASSYSRAGNTSGEHSGCVIKLSPHVFMTLDEILAYSTAELSRKNQDDLNLKQVWELRGLCCCLLYIYCQKREKFSPIEAGTFLVLILIRQSVI